MNTTTILLHPPSDASNAFLISLSRVVIITALLLAYMHLLAAVARLGAQCCKKAREPYELAPTVDGWEHVGIYVTPNDNRKSLFARTHDLFKKEYANGASAWRYDSDGTWCSVSAAQVRRNGIPLTADYIGENV